jgi:hypothetical protein
MFFHEDDLDIPYILKHVSPEEIFEAWGLPVRREKFRAPYRKDRNPDCKFFRTVGGKLKMRDYAGYFHGDCFDYVQFMDTCNLNDALIRIAARFKLRAASSSSGVEIRKPSIPHIYIEPQTCSIKVKRMEWTAAHRKFWARWDFSEETLNRYNIAPIERVWLNDGQIYWHGVKKELAFAYWFGNYDYKIYFPERDKHRFLHNNPNILQGYDQLPARGEFLIVTKSLKDVAKLSEFHIPAVAPMAETVILSPDQEEGLRKRFPVIFSLYDIDKLPCVRSMQKMKKLYGIPPLFFPRTQPKDFTDFYEKYGREDTQLLINQMRDTLM